MCDSLLDTTTVIGRPLERRSDGRSGGRDACVSARLSAFALLLVQYKYKHKRQSMLP